MANHGDDGGGAVFISETIYLLTSAAVEDTHVD